MSNLTSTCELRIDEYEPGVVNASFDFDQPKTLNLANTEIAKSWKSVEIHWHYPAEFLTLIIETPFTQQQQPYSISIDNNLLVRGTSAVYRIVDEKETNVKTTACKLVIECDSNYQVILKLHATPTAAYMANIKYDVIEK
jgi:hypothetical protein